MPPAGDPSGRDPHRPPRSQPPTSPGGAPAPLAPWGPEGVPEEGAGRLPLTEHTCPAGSSLRGRGDDWPHAPARPCWAPPPPPSRPRRGSAPTRPQPRVPPRGPAEGRGREVRAASGLAALCTPTNAAPAPAGCRLAACGQVTGARPRGRIIEAGRRAAAWRAGSFARRTPSVSAVATTSSLQRGKVGSAESGAWVTRSGREGCGSQI